MVRRTRVIVAQLGPVQHAAGIRGEPIASVHRAPVIPENEVADLPTLRPVEFRSGTVCPDCVEQRLTLLEREPGDVSPLAPAQVEMWPACPRMPEHQRMQGALRLARIGGRGVALARPARAVER